MQRTLEQYINALGETHLGFLSTLHIGHHIMKTIARGEPIAESKAKLICDKLSKEFGRPITIADIKDLKTC